MVKLPGDTTENYPEPTYILDATNFVPNDGVNTEHTVGTYDYSGEGDYLLVVDSPNQVVQRWFIIDSVRNRQGQYTLTLRRDLVADYYNIIVDAPMYVEKATLLDSDPAIWNSETVSVNQIKTKEYQLRDLTNCGWIVGYYARNYAGGDLEITYRNSSPDMQLDVSIDTYLSRFKRKYSPVGSLFIEYNRRRATNKQYIIDGKYASIIEGIYKWNDGQLDDAVSNAAMTYNVDIGDVFTPLGTQFNQLFTEEQNKNLLNIAKNYVTNPGEYATTIEYTEIKNLNNRIVQDSLGNIYKINVSEQRNLINYEINSNITQINGIPALKNYLVQQMQSLGYTYNPNSSNIPFTYIATVYDINIVATIQNDITFTLPFPAPDKRLHLNDAPYDMFCIPYLPKGTQDGQEIYLYKLGDDTNNVVINISPAQTAMGIAQAIAEKIGKDNIYDLQLLPYYPDASAISYDEVNQRPMINIQAVMKEQTNFTSGLGALIGRKDVATEKCQILFPLFSSGSYQQSQLKLVDSETNTPISLPIPLGNKKIANECDMHRLCSPNYNGQFQFTASKLNGITGFNVDYTYLPYSPYIHVNPLFQGLYGKDFDDARGLICQGDFSISYLSDAWENYQVQNKNYANIFARQKSHLEVNQEIQREQQIFNAITGTVMGGAAGAVTGSKGGIPGMIAGGILGTAASAIGGALDVSRGDILRNEALSYQQDMYNYQMDNIKAMPDSLAKVTAYTQNNKLFPLLEYYTCTDIEKQAIANKIAYNGMTVGRIGTMAEFINNEWSYNNIEDKGYIKGQLIRFEDFGEDFHIVNSISGELYKGVFTK